MRYIEDEVVPYIRQKVGDVGARIATAGASFGAFHAANTLFRRPDPFDTTIAISGFYDLGPDYQARRMLEAKQLPHWLDGLGYDVNHDSPWWRKMLPYYVEKLGW